MYTYYLVIKLNSYKVLTVLLLIRKVRGVKKSKIKTNFKLQKPSTFLKTGKDTT